MLSISATEEWRAAHHGAHIGLLDFTGIDNTLFSTALEGRKREVEAQLRTRYQGYTRQDFLALPAMQAYDQYYKRFDKTYHVQLQVESIVLKGKNLPNVSPLVDANFISEVETLVLTAGHDAGKLSGPVSIDVSREGDSMTQMNGTRKELRAGDMIMRDSDGICCSIIYGQDNRSPISAQTTHVLYVAYAPVGVSRDLVNAQLQQIEDLVHLFAPAATGQRLILSADTR